MADDISSVAQSAHPAPTSHPAPVFQFGNGKQPVIVNTRVDENASSKATGDFIRAYGRAGLFAELGNLCSALVGWLTLQIQDAELPRLIVSCSYGDAAKGLGLEASGSARRAFRVLEFVGAIVVLGRTGAAGRNAKNIYELTHPSAPSAPATISPEHYANWRANVIRVLARGKDDESAPATPFKIGAPANLFAGDRIAGAQGAPATPLNRVAGAQVRAGTIDVLTLTPTTCSSSTPREEDRRSESAVAAAAAAIEKLELWDEATTERLLAIPTTTDIVVRAATLDIRGHGKMLEEHTGLLIRLIEDPKKIGSKYRKTAERQAAALLAETSAKRIPSAPPKSENLEIDRMRQQLAEVAADELADLVTIAIDTASNGFTAHRFRKAAEAPLKNDLLVGELFKLWIAKKTAAGSEPVSSSADAEPLP